MTYRVRDKRTRRTFEVEELRPCEWYYGFIWGVIRVDGEMVDIVKPNSRQAKVWHTHLLDDVPKGYYYTEV